MALTNPGIIEFDAPVQSGDEKFPSARWVNFPFSVEELFGTKGRVPVKVTFDGIPYTGSMVKMGEDCHMVLMLKSITEKLGDPETVHVTLALDETPRVVTLDEDEQAALDQSSAALEYWRTLSFSHQRQYHQWIGEAKKPETRARRIAKMVEMLLQKEKLR